MLAAFCILLGLFSLSSLINKNPFDGTISRLVSIVCGFSVALSVDRKVFFDTFKKTVFFICLVAIFAEALAYIVPSLFEHFPVVTNTSGRNFYVFFVGAFGFDNIEQVFKRSMGIFWEPGAFSIYIVLSLAMELFSSRKKMSRILVDIIALVFTFSTTGYIAFSFLLIVFLLFKVGSRRIITKISVLFILSLLVILLTSRESQIGHVVFGKIIEGGSSSAARFSSFYNGLYLSFQKPFFGLGINSTSMMKFYLSSGYAKYSNGGADIINTVTGFMVYYGIPFSAVVLLGSLMFFKRFSSSFITALFLFVVLMLCYFGERFFSFLPFVISFYGFKKDTHTVLNN